MENTSTVLETILRPSPESTQITRSVVRTVDGNGTIVVACAENGESVRCTLLQSVEGHLLQLNPGDLVLVWLGTTDAGDGVVLGRIGTSLSRIVEQGTVNPQSSDKTLREQLPSKFDADNKIPDELIIEARQCLTLKCGEGSITLREDGKMLIKGKDLVSRATRMNRVKGGAVAIN